MKNTKTTDKMLEATKELWKFYNEHPFVQGIQDGSLAKDKFKYYIMQDYLYLKEYAKVFAIGVAKAKNYTQTQIQHLVDIFIACSRYELAFWQMAWNQSC